MKVTSTKYGQLAIISYPAEGQFTLPLEWYTDVIQAYDSTESRFSLRTKPRIELSYTISTSPSKFQETWNTIYANLRGNWAVPIWCSTQVVSNILSTDTVIQCNTLHYQFNDEMALLWADESNWAFINITSQSKAVTGSINCSQIGKSFTSAYLIPVIKGRIKGDVSDKTSGFESVFTIPYVLDNDLGITDTAPAQYLGYDIYTTLATVKDSTMVKFNQSQHISDSIIGIQEFYTNWIKPQLHRNILAIIKSPLEMYNWLLFLYRRQGKYRPFWLPTFENNLIVKSTGTITSAIQVQADSFITDNVLRNYIAIETDTGWTPVAISNPTVIDSTTIQLNLTPIVSIPAANIKRISYLGLCRLDDDMAYINIRQATAQCSIDIVEVIS